MNICKTIWFSKLIPKITIPSLSAVNFTCFLVVGGLISIDPNKVCSSVQKFLDCDVVISVLVKGRSCKSFDLVDISFEWLASAAILSKGKTIFSWSPSNNINDLNSRQIIVSFDDGNTKLV